MLKDKLSASQIHLPVITEVTTRILMGVRNISLSYSQNEGTVLPGYLPKTRFMGISKVDGIMAPGAHLSLVTRIEDLQIMLFKTVG